ncbi:MAG: hypothetical protein PUF50_06910 [Erysipelotrichaceae bacterium]|nr:hypothetical protein [Erysipelotrichaceae bacterium]
MNRIVKAKIHYMFLNPLSDFHPNYFKFEGKKYRITNKDILKQKRYPDVLIFFDIVWVIRLGVKELLSPLYWFIVIITVYFIVKEWKRFPDNIFEYLELMETRKEK